MVRGSVLLAGIALGTPLGLAGVTATAAPSVAGCQPGRAVMKHVPGSEGAGQTGYRLSVSNVGGAPCVFQNEPKLTLLGTGGKALPTHVRWTGKLKNITIGAGKTVRAKLRFSPDIPGRGEPQKGRCEPQARHVRIVLALHLKTIGRAMSVSGPVHPPTSVCEHGTISATPLH